MASAVIGALRINFSADTAEFRRNMTDAEKIAERFGRSIGSSIRKNVLAFGSAVAAAAGPAALGYLIKSSIETVSAQVDLANRVGASVAAIQTLTEAAKLSGSSQEALAKTLGVLNARLGEAARSGSGKAFEALQKLGLSAKALSEMDADERIKTLSDRMADLGYSTQQTADAMRNLGIKNQEIINLFIEGSGSIDKVRKELKDLGVTLSDVDARNIEEAGDSLDKLWLIAEGLGNQIASEFAPDIKQLSDYFLDLAKSGTLAKTSINSLRDAQETIGSTMSTTSMEAGVLKSLWDGLVSSSSALVRLDFEGFLKANHEADANAIAIWKAHQEKLNAIVKGPTELFSTIDAYLAKLNYLQSGNRDMTVDDGGDSETEAAEKKKKKEAEERAKELASYQEHLASRLTSLQESLMTERETEMNEYDLRLKDLEDFHNNGLLSDQEYRDLLLKNSQAHATALKQIDDEVAKNNERNAKKQMDTYFDIADNITSALSSLFGDSKAWAIAEAIINTATAITKALAVYGPTPLGFSAAAAAAAAGAAQLASIRKQSSRGGGGGSPSVSRGGTSSSDSSSQQSSGTATQQQTLYISGLTNESFYSGEMVRALVEKLQDYQRDGGKIILGSA